jgi:hypothetical protein
MKALQWLTNRNFKATARTLAAPVLEAIEHEIQVLQGSAKALLDVFLRAEVQARLKELQKARTLITDAAHGNALQQPRMGLPWLEKNVVKGLEAVERSEDARRERDKLHERIQAVDAALDVMYAATTDLPEGAAKEHGGAIFAIRRLRAKLADEKRQREFHATLKELEIEIQGHQAWIEGMGTAWRELGRARVQLESLLSTDSWRTTKDGADRVEQAQRHIADATRAWNGGRWTRTASATQDAMRQIEMVRDASDRTLNQARDEISMWKKFVEMARSYSEMKETLAAFPAELPGTDLQRWEDYRQESTRQIDTAASQVAQLAERLPFRVCSVLDWKEPRLEAHCDFAREVRDGCKETLALLEKRHRQRRRRYRSPVKAP